MIETPVRMQLNLPALERLLGGDTQMEVELRYQIVQEFAKRHLKAVAAEPAFEKIIESHRKVIDAEVRSLVGDHVWKDGKTVAVLQERVKKLVEDSLEGCLREAVKRCFDAKVAEYEANAKAHIERFENRMLYEANLKVKAVTDKLDALLKDRVDEFFNARVQAEVQRRLAAAAAVAA
jgi:hypothetical protein